MNQSIDQNRARAVQAIPAASSVQQAASPATITVTPNPCPIDQPFAMRVAGLLPGQEVTIRSEMLDANAEAWRAEATFVADAQGLVDLTSDAPLAGSYTGVHPMGLIWSAKPAYSQSFYGVAFTPSPTRITALVDEREVARVDVDRPDLLAGARRSLVTDAGLYGSFFRLDDDHPVPVVIVLGGSNGGLNPSTEWIAALLTSHGYAALALAHFGAPGLPPTLANVPLEYFEKAISWLGQQPRIRSDSLGVIGISRGGELALLLGASYPAITAVISYVGSGVVFSGLSENGASLRASPWSVNGAPLPFVADYFAALSWERATIPVERINGPVLLVSGCADTLWPSTGFSDIASQRLRAQNHRYTHAHLAYEGAGHTIGPPYQPTTGIPPWLGGTAAGTAAANADSWPRVLRMLDDRLKR